MSAAIEVHGPREVPATKRKGVVDGREHLVVIKTPNRIEHHRFANPAEAQSFADAAQREAS